MLAHRIIPTLLYRGDQLVKGERFNGWRSVGHIRQAVELYAKRGVDELILLDIGATPEGRGPDFAQVRRLTDIGFSPLTVGGGVRSVQDAEQLLAAGADKVAICTAALEKPELINQCSLRFGNQAIVVAIDVIVGDVYFTVGHCGSRVHKVPQHPGEWAKQAEALGAGEILLTSIDNEGTLRGYDVQVIYQVSNSVGIPVIAHGGCSGPQDMFNAISVGASAVAAGALFQFTDHTPASCADYLERHGIEVRRVTE